MKVFEAGSGRKVMGKRSSLETQLPYWLKVAIKQQSWG